MSENEEDKKMQELLGSLTTKIYENLKRMAMIQYNGLYLSSVVKSFSTGFLENMKKQLPEAAEILKLFLTFLEKQSIKIHDETNSKEIEEMTRK